MEAEKYPPPQERFKKVILSLAELMRKELIKARKKNVKVISENIVEFGITLVEESDERDLIKGFIKRSFPIEEKTGERISCWDSVFEKDRRFFFENSSVIFGELSSGIIDGIIVLLEENENLLEGTWKHLFSLVKICINFIYLSKDPKVEKKKEGGFDIIYTNKKYEYINVEDLASKWGVNLLNAK